MPAQRRTARDDRRRELGQNFLVDRRAVDRILAAADVRPGELVFEIGGGRGALTIPLAQAGARVVVADRDPVWAERLLDRAARSDVGERIQVIAKDFRSVPLPAERYRVVASPPFRLTTAVCEHLFGHPRSGPWRADLLIQRAVARKRISVPPSTLRSAAWAPWWTFHIGPVVSRRAFRPVPKVDAALLTAVRRHPPVLPEGLAPILRDLLRPAWESRTSAP